VLAVTVTLNLSPDVEQRLRVRAAQSGQPLEAYLEQLITREVSTLGKVGPALPLEEQERLLDPLSENEVPLPPLPADFSRADRLHRLRPGEEALTPPCARRSEGIDFFTFSCLTFACVWE
jgi:plasmid stability protein